MNPSQMRHPAFVRKLLRAMREAQRTRRLCDIDNRKGETVLRVEYDPSAGIFHFRTRDGYNMNYPVRAVIRQVMAFPTWFKLCARIPQPGYGTRRWCQPDGKRVD